MRKRVLFILSSANEDSGAANVWKSVVGLMPKRGIEPIVVLPRAGGLKEHFESAGIIVWVMPFFWWVKPISGRRLTGKEEIHALIRPIESILNGFAERRIARLCDEDGIDLVYIFDGVIGCGAKAADSKGIPYVFHLQELLREDLGYELADPSDAIPVLEGASRFVAISEPVKTAWSHLATTPCSVIYNGLPGGDERTMPIRSDLLSRETVELVLVGNIAPHKGQLVAIEAAATLRHKLGPRNFVLSLYGKVQDRKYASLLQAKIDEYGLSGVVRIKGFCDNVEAVFSAADIALVCSRAEAFGLVTIEAMREGCLVVGADSGATAELLSGDRGILFSSGSSDDLADALQSAFGDPMRVRRTAERGQAFARTLTAERQEDQVASLVHEVVGQ